MSKTHCDFCKQKLKIVNFKCSKCESTFCTKCRLPELHECNFDYKSEKVQLQKVIGDKIQKI
jgi:predicted nucleic acid binding AN1-type Zn finger protein